MGILGIIAILIAIADGLAKIQLDPMNEASKKSTTIVKTAITSVTTLNIITIDLAKDGLKTLPLKTMYGASPWRGYASILLC